MRIKAFTLVELLVSLLVGAIILTLAWNVYFFLGDYRQVIENKASEQILIKNVEYRLTKDMSDALAVHYSDSVLSISQMNDSITYQFLQDELIRNDRNYSDTVNVSGIVKGFRPLQTFDICLQMKNELEYCFPVKSPVSSFKHVSTKDENP